MGSVLHKNSMDFVEKLLRWGGLRHNSGLLYGAKSVIVD